MSVDDVGAERPPGSSEAPAFDRSPPQDVAAEQCALGGMLLSKDAIADVVEILKTNDFYRPIHATIFDAIIDLYGRGEPADPITVSAALADSGDLGRIGGAPYLHTLIASVPTAANASYYARIVADRAVLRRLVEAGTRIVQLGYGSASGQGRDVDDVVDMAQQAVYDVTERRVNEEFAVLAEMLQPTLDEIEAVGAQGDVLTGVPTGFTDLDRLLNGLHAGQLIVVAGRPGLGKALALETPLPTPDGWTTMGEVMPGDQLLGADGRPTTVIATSPVMTGRPCYEVEFSDGTVIVADASHQWSTHDAAARRNGRPPGIRTTEEIAATLRANGEPNHSIDSPTGTRLVVDVRPTTSVHVRCVSVDNGDHLYLAGRSGVPTHNSTASMDFARNAAIRFNMASAIFSLEMSKIEIVMRLLSAEARVPLHVLRSGQLSDDDWTKLARRMGEISEAPLFVDDTASMNLMEIRAKARRLKQRHDLKLIVVDYLQLMTSPKRTESRQQEVSELSRGLKLLAKEVECPVIAVSQLNRGPEQRTDKRPQLSDLRESGCLTADTTLLRADTGAPVSFETLIRDGYDGVSVWSIDEQRRLVPAPITNVFAAGTKDVYRLVLASGRTVKASANHRFHTPRGWRELGELRPGDRLAVPRRAPAPLAAGLGWSEHRLGLLAHLIGDGCVLARRPLRYTSADEENLAFVEAAASAEFGIAPRRTPQGNRQHVHLPTPERLAHGRRNPIHQWFHDLGIADLRSHQKRIPAALYAAGTAEVSTFLRHLWATDGGVFDPGPDARRPAPRIHYATSSRELADGVANLLDRLEIPTRIYTTTRANSHRPGYQVTVAGANGMRRFCVEVGVHGAGGRAAAAYPDFSATTGHGANADALPIEVASDDLLWDEITAVEPLGPMPVFDATVKGTHNFVADRVIAHNSIEQDADVVILLHRDDYYDKESPRAGEADFIVAKHRNGPTDTVTVAAQLHLSRFVDMAI